MGCLASPDPFFALAAVHYKVSFFLWKLPCSFLRSYINGIFPAFRNSFSQWRYVQRHSASIPLILGPSLVFLNALSFCGWHELKDCRSFPWSFLTPLQNDFSQWGSLEQAKHCLQMCVFFLIDFSEEELKQEHLSLLRPLLFGF